MKNKNLLILIFVGVIITFIGFFGVSYTQREMKIETILEAEENPTERPVNGNILTKDAGGDHYQTATFALG